MKIIFVYLNTHKCYVSMGKNTKVQHNGMIQNFTCHWNWRIKALRSGICNLFQTTTLYEEITWPDDPLSKWLIQAKPWTRSSTKKNTQIPKLLPPPPQYRLETPDLETRYCKYNGTIWRNCHENGVWKEPSLWSLPESSMTYKWKVSIS